MAKILIVDDEGKMRASLAMGLDAPEHQIKDSASAEEAFPLIDTFMPDIIITDIRMPGISGLELLKIVKQKYPRIEVIVMTAYADAATGIEAMRNGALEYVTKPFEIDEIAILIRQVIEKQVLTKEIAQLRDAVEMRSSLDTLTSKSRVMQDVIAQAKIVAPRDTTVLIRGKSGTGKELIARGIHNESRRKTFVPVNCGAIPETLLESELFGFEKGAFTGAHAQKIGLFERAEDGTIFLDEIGDISQQLQIKLLRVLQEKEFTRVGGNKSIVARARVIAATNRNLETAVEEGEFREDLYYRLNVFPLFVPSLTERLEDLTDLVNVFLAKYSHTGGVDDNVYTCLMEYAWPGNIRELENCVERAVIMAHGTKLTKGNLPGHIRDNRTLRNPSLFQLPDSGISLDEWEKRLVLQALEKAFGNKSEAARLLGISRRSLYTKLKAHNIHLNSEAEPPVNQ